MDIVLVCGAPGSGKSCLARLLADSYRDRGEKVFYIRRWEDLDVSDSWGGVFLNCLNHMMKNQGEILWSWRMIRTGF